MKSEKSRASDNVFEDLGFSAREAGHLKVKADLLIALQEVIARRRLRQKDAARILRITQPRVSNLLAGRLDLFSTDAERRPTFWVTQAGIAAGEANGVHGADDILADTSRFMNREISWLQFNRRVLEEAENKKHPLLERMRFLSISANNLDEFFMVRVAGIAGQIRQGIETISDDGLISREQMRAITEEIALLQDDQQKAWKRLGKELAKERIFIVEPKDITKTDREKLEEYFLESVFPMLTPLSIDPAHPFPFIPNLGYTLVYDLRHQVRGETMTSLIRLPGTSTA